MKSALLLVGSNALFCLMGGVSKVKSVLVRSIRIYPFASQFCYQNEITQQDSFNILKDKAI